MTKKIIEDYVENEKERSEGNMDTRHKNFECENPDTNLGCDIGITVAG